MALKNTVSKHNSRSTRKRSNYKIRERRRMRLILKKLKAATELISQVQQNLEKRGRGRKYKKKDYELFEDQLRMMEAKVAEEKEETVRMRQEIGNMIQDAENKETELELIRMRHAQLCDEVVYLSVVEEELTGSPRSPN